MVESGKKITVVPADGMGFKDNFRNGSTKV